MADPYDDFDIPDEPDEWEEAIQNCGQTRFGLCLLAGTEYCDFDCPLRDELE